jgi:L-fucose isomerase-like protein
MCIRDRDGYRAAPEPVVLQLAGSVTAGASAFGETDQRSVAEAARLHPALRRLVEEDRLDAVAVRCFDLLSSVQTSGCVALAELNDEGIVAGCEGDLVSTVAMLWVHALTGGAAWMANPSRVDPASGRVRLAHCTIARSLTQGYALRSHFESGIGVGIAGQLPPGPVTLVRIGGTGMDRLFLAEGQAEPAGPDEALCRTQVDVTVGPEAVAELLARPLGNHLVVVPGRHAAWLRGYHDLVVRPPD